MDYVKPNIFYYRIAQGASALVSSLIFRRKMLRNEIKGKKGAFVVIANHEAALDFVNLIGASSRPMSFVISKAFFSTLPIRGFMEKMGVIPKQQFQTSVRDLKRIKTVIDNGEPVVIYPAGLMCEDGLSTPIPSATYKFLKWLDTDVYVARATGSYFVMPKWTSGFRPGRTYMDIYKLFNKEDLATMDLDQIRQKTDEALLFDAYREQENVRSVYAKNDHIAGLENVLYICPHCGEEFTMQIEGDNTLRCGSCGYSQQADKYGFLHKTSQHGPEIRYISDWSKRIYNRTKTHLVQHMDTTLSAKTRFHMIRGNKFQEVGQGELNLSKEGFSIVGNIAEEELRLHVPIGNIPTLPFKPGRYLEVQDGGDIYRCVLEDGRQVIRFINMVKVFYELKNP